MNAREQLEIINRQEAIRKGSEAIEESLTMLGVNPHEVSEFGHETTAEILARIVLDAAARA